MIAAKRRGLASVILALTMPLTSGFSPPKLIQSSHKKVRVTSSLQVASSSSISAGTAKVITFFLFLCNQNWDLQLELQNLAFLRLAKNGASQCSHTSSVAL